ncbi:phosphoadenylyl-sulfate reductase [Aquabacterium soli]|uniref:Adenosine 5'-phosphosulfate reductase n=1 Tax=Aquabacterium soli TaxID=2493092 RepID=A0A426V283_9BURK|nr:phosphoadenylyl-sulfate reductase [Aquabacterium soli]RRS01014.1 phosphoadenylyl-sulfate reductase [Aquabacterium soli]
MSDTSSLLPETSSLIGGPAPSGSAIKLYARASADFEAKLADTVALLKAAAAEHPGQVVQATSLGVEDMILTDLIARHRLPIAIGTLETGMLHAETSALIPTIESHYAAEGLKVEVYHPQAEAVIEFVRHNGEKPMYKSIDLRKACCGVRKIEPLGRMLAQRTGWITGLRREQSNNRGGMLAREQDDKGRAKFNPLIEWTWGDVWHYVNVNKVPYNPLHDQFMPSIGCEPCTRAIAVGEDFRAGRWWWEDESAKECGLHVHQPDEPVAEELPPLVSSIESKN